MSLGSKNHEEDASVIYGLEHQARALTAQVAETELIRFVVGTHSLKQENQIHLVEFQEENNSITKWTCGHLEGEVWQVSSSPADPQLLATVYNAIEDGKVNMRSAVWRLPENLEESTDYDSSNAMALKKECQFPDVGAKCLMWHPSGSTHQCLLVCEQKVHLYDMEASGSLARCACARAVQGKGDPRFVCSAWNPHHNSSQVALGCDSSIRGWDFRSDSDVYCIEGAHGQTIRDVHFNPNKQYHLASCGDDGLVKVWDTRSPTSPLKVINEHAHWVWRVRFNMFHDQLVLTCSSDTTVLLHNLVSVSSEPFGHLIDKEDEEEEEGEGEEDGDAEEGDDGDNDASRKTQVRSDGVLSRYEEHEESVYGAEWSAADPWVFASLSYDGRLLVSRVPRSLKYDILL